MKRSAMLFACVVAAAALASTAEGAANSTYKLDTSDPNAAQLCTSRGGAVSTDPLGAKLCTLPTSACTASTGKTNPYTLDPNDPNAAKACASACGSVSTNASGQKMCTKTGALGAAPAPTTAREPHN